MKRTGFKSRLTKQIQSVKMRNSRSFARNRWFFKIQSRQKKTEEIISSIYSMLFQDNDRKKHSTRLRRRIRFRRRRWIRYSGNKTQRSTSWESRKEQRNKFSLHNCLSCESVDSFVCSGSRYGENKQTLYWSCEILRETLIFYRRMMEHSNSLQFSL